MPHPTQCFISYQKWRHCICDMAGNFFVNSSTSFPLLHFGSSLEMFCEMITSLIPGREVCIAEAAAALDVCCFCLPAFHAVDHLTSMDQSQVLPQMIFSVKGASFSWLFKTGREIVFLDVFYGRINLSTKHTHLITTAGARNHRA